MSSGDSGAARPALRVLSMVEGTWVTGPIKPLLMFANLARRGGNGRPAVNLSLITTVRSKDAHFPTNMLLTGAAEAKLQVDVLLERRAWDPRVLTQLCQLIDYHRPDIVETHQVKCHFILAQALLWRRIRKDFTWIAYHHGYTKANLKLRFYEMLDRWSLRTPDRIVTVCRPFAAELIRHGARADHVVVIPNTVESRPPPDAVELTELRRRWQLSEEDFVILSVGRLSPEKGHIHLIEAFRKLRSELPPQRRLTLVIIGDGPKRRHLESDAADLGDNVRFLGHQANVWPFYFIADIFVLPSHSEGSPLVLFEAMAAGRAIVATSVGGIPETVENAVSALLVPPRDIMRLKEALRSLCADPAGRARMAVAASDALKRFSPETYRDRILDLYREVSPVS
jgi:glycosyltransferase involved in cell wall biosynthesis